MYVDFEFENALQEFKYLSYEGHKQSQYMLGSMYYEGMGIKVDEEAGYFWLLKSAADGAGDPRAMVDLGWIIAANYTKEDFNKAQRWYKLAIKKGYPLGEVMLKNLLDAKEKYNK